MTQKEIEMTKKLDELADFITDELKQIFDQPTGFTLNYLIVSGPFTGTRNIGLVTNMHKSTVLPFTKHMLKNFKNDKDLNPDIDPPDKAD